MATERLNEPSSSLSENGLQPSSTGSANRGSRADREPYRLPAAVRASAAERRRGAPQQIALGCPSRFHRPFEAHADQFGTRGAVVLNLPLPTTMPDVSVAMLRDVDAVVRAAERDSWAAADLLATSLVAATGQQTDWPDLLAAALRDDPSLCLADQADSLGLAAETLARGFKRAYGVSPKRYRAEVRALQAWRTLPGSPLPLAQLALALGFTDQAHMTRDVVALTGRTPAALRRGPPPGGQLDARATRR